MMRTALRAHAARSLSSRAAVPRHDWSLSEIREIYEQPFLELLYQAATVHRARGGQGRGCRGRHAA